MKNEWENLVIAIIASGILVGLIWIFWFLPIVNALVVPEAEGMSYAMGFYDPYDDPFVQIVLFQLTGVSVVVFFVLTVGFYLMIGYLRKRQQ